MAMIVEKWTQRCGTCGISAYVTEWDCGCVDVRYDESARGCRRCWESRDLERHCGKEGRPTPAPPQSRARPPWSASTMARTPGSTLVC